MVQLYAPDNKIVDAVWSSYFYVDSGIVIVNLWGDYVGDWQQNGNKVTVKSAQWIQHCPPQCMTLEFIANKPNPYIYTLVTVDSISKSLPHCGFIVKYPESCNDVVHINFGPKKRTSDTIGCISLSTLGCFSPNIKNITGPGTSCDSDAVAVPDSCPLCPCSKLNNALQDNGKTLDDYITSIEQYLELPTGTFKVVSVSNDLGCLSSIEVYIDSSVTTVADVTLKLESKNYTFNVGECKSFSVSDSSRFHLSFATIFVMMIISLIF